MLSSAILVHGRIGAALTAHSGRVDQIDTLLADRQSVRQILHPAVLLRGHFRDVSVERIMRVLTRLGCEVDIVVTPRGSTTPSAPIHVHATARLG